MILNLSSILLCSQTINYCDTIVIYGYGDECYSSHIMCISFPEKDSIILSSDDFLSLKARVPQNSIPYVDHRFQIMYSYLSEKNYSMFDFKFSLLHESVEFAFPLADLEIPLPSSTDFMKSFKIINEDEFDLHYNTSFEIIYFLSNGNSLYELKENDLCLLDCAIIYDLSIQLTEDKDCRNEINFPEINIDFTKNH